MSAPVRTQILIVVSMRASSFSAPLPQTEHKSVKLTTEIASWILRTKQLGVFKKHKSDGKTENRCANIQTFLFRRQCNPLFSDRFPLVTQEISPGSKYPAEVFKWNSSSFYRLPVDVPYICGLQIPDKVRQTRSHTTQVYCTCAHGTARKIHAHIVCMKTCFPVQRYVSKRPAKKVHPHQEIFSSKKVLIVAPGWRPSAVCSFWMVFCDKLTRCRLQTNWSRSKSWQTD